jgi:hypothetical protein
MVAFIYNNNKLMLLDEERTINCILLLFLFTSSKSQVEQVEYGIFVIILL